MQLNERFSRLPSGEILGNTPHQIFQTAVTFGSNDPGIIDACESLYGPYANLDAHSSPIRVMINRINDNRFELRVSSFLPQIYPSQWEALLLFKTQLIKYFWKDKHQPLLLHAGAVSKDNKGILLVGDDGSGKTTQTIGLVDRGYHFLSDEYGVLDLDTGLIKHYPAPISLRPDSPILKMSLVGLRDKVDSRLYEINIHETDPNRRGEHKPVIPAPISNQSMIDVHPRAIIFLEPNFGNLPRLEQVTEKEAIIQTLSRNANWHARWSFPSDSMVEQFMNRVGDEIPVFKLAVGELNQTLELIDGMVAQL